MLRSAVVIPVYNMEQYLAECIESALAQTYRPLEVIVVDDGSTDGTGAVAQRFGTRIRYVRQQNQGVYVASMAGLHAAGDAEYVRFVGADDLLHPQCLEIEMMVAEARPEVAVITSNLLTFNNGEEAGSPGFDAERLVGVGRHVRVITDPVQGCRQYGSSLAIGASTFRRDAVLEVGGYDQTLRAAGDTELWWRLAVRYSMAYISVPLYGYRLHRGSMSFNADRLAAVLPAYHKVFATMERFRPEAAVYVRALAHRAACSFIWARILEGRRDAARRLLRESPLVGRGWERAVLGILARLPAPIPRMILHLQKFGRRQGKPAPLQPLAAWLQTDYRAVLREEIEAIAAR
jgi:glycosyltransferase involved in cell wall biosynthesis